MLNKLLNVVARFRRDDEGVTLVEYGVAVALAVFVGTGALVTLGGSVETSMGNAGTAMTIAP